MRGRVGSTVSHESMTSIQSASAYLNPSIRSRNYADKISELRTIGEVLTKQVRRIKML